MRQFLLTAMSCILLTISCQPSIMRSQRDQSAAATWARALTSHHSFVSISFGDERHGIVTGTDEHFWLTSDSGQTWTEHTIRGEEIAMQGGAQNLIESAMTPSGRIYVLGHLEDVGSGIFTSLDAGRTWKVDDYPNSSLNDVDVVGDQAWIVGTINNAAVVLHSNGQGAWQQIWRGSDQQYLTAVDFIDANTGWTVGADGLILHTTDGGHTWRVQQSPSEGNLEAVAFTDTRSGYAVGQGGVIFYTSDGGSTWSKQNSSTQANLLNVVAVNSNTAWAVGQRGTMLYTDDAGRHWHQRDFSTQADIYAVALKGNQVWIATSAGSVLRSPPGE